MKPEIGRFPNPPLDFDTNDRFHVSIAEKISFAKWWEDNIGRRFGLTPRQIADVLSDGLGNEAVVDFYRFESGTAENFVQASITGSSGKEIIYLAGQTIHLLPVAIENIEVDLVDVVPSRQGQGTSAALMANIKKLADLLDIRTLTVEAYMSGGPYAWLSFGFLPEDDAWEEIREQIARKVEEFKGSLPEDVIERLELVLGSTTSRALVALLDERDLVVSTSSEGVTRNIPLVKALMADSGQRWYGVLDLEDEVSSSLLDDCIERK